MTYSNGYILDSEGKVLGNYANGHIFDTLRNIKGIMPMVISMTNPTRSKEHIIMDS